MSERISEQKRHRPWFGWNPGPDTSMAFLTGIIWIGAYYLLTHFSDPPLSTLYGILAMLLVVVVPVWWFCLHRGRPLRELGITGLRWKESLLVSIIVAVPFFWLIAGQYGSMGAEVLAPQIVANALILWEPFFVFCWLELRFGEAFGIIPGILLAGLFFGAYHIGTYPPAAVGVLALYGILFAAIFRLTDNLLSMWPIAWAASSAKGTLAGGMLFAWNDVTQVALVLLLQLAFIGWIWRNWGTDRGRSSVEAGQARRSREDPER
ncbi:membrane protease YdiL (CAAX protease family) [Methanolinea mesophila]|uniref:CPBP family intramembrane glutamic endopeptidase n=1 Tax=Methanolinea mesophila TaxID=547055 RepID=UPI001AE9D7F4|nr:CPBP family intramembrane glutamic endopeptidase [Methanolinea mesophila]MBP1928283.1 membrane protease YdiL (CAAX protease family) [Methanolinea mesophila]